MKMNCTPIVLTNFNAVPIRKILMQTIDLYSFKTQSLNSLADQDQVTDQ